VIVLAVVGLSPQFSWVPEVPLLAVAVLVPIVGYLMTGMSAGRRTQRVRGGVAAGATAGVISGVIGGVCYALFGKSLLNIVVGLGLGLVAGALWGMLGAVVSLRAREE
jgi:hypothetical protein